MKVLFVVLIVVAVSQAGKIDWDKYDNERVVGGEEATPHQFPYQAGIFPTYGNGGGSSCGGSLISPNRVLTAGHCLQGAVSVKVILGAHVIQEYEPTQIRIISTDFVMHPNYSSPSNLNNDIAIIKLPQSVELNENIQLVKLPSRSDEFNTFEDESATVSGWGHDSDNATSISEVLRFVSNPVISNSECSLTFNVKSFHICVSGKGGKSACSGDSGGPLVATVDDQVKQVGVVSYGGKCEVGTPAVYTRVTSYLDWIAENGVTIE